MLALLLAIILILIIVYLYIYSQLNKIHNFISGIIPTYIFQEELNDFTGYLICVEKHTILNEINLIMGLKEILGSNAICNIIDLSKESEINGLDLKFLERLKIRIFPSIVYISEKSEILELINFTQFDGLSTSQALDRVNQLVRKV